MCASDQTPESTEIQRLAAAAARLADSAAVDVTQSPWRPDQTAPLLAAATRLHATAVHAAETDVAIDDRQLTATDALIAASALLQAADLNAFDLSLWLSRSPQDPR